MRVGQAKRNMLMAMAIYGTVGIFVRHIPLPSATIAFFRGLLGMVFLLVLMAISRKKMDLNAIRKNLPILLLSGLLTGALIGVVARLCLPKLRRFTRETP